MTSPGVGLIPVQDFDKVANMANVTTGYGDANNPNIMFINTKKFPDPKVRQAMAYAMNRQLIVDQLLKGQGELVDGMLGQNHPYYNKDIPLYSYDPEKAKALLNEAGWDFNQSIEFVVPTGNKIREQASDIIAENLKAAGLKVQVTKLDFPTTYQRALKHEYDLTVINLGFILDPNSVLGLFKTGSVLILQIIRTLKSTSCWPKEQKSWSHPSVSRFTSRFSKSCTTMFRQLPCMRISKCMRRPKPGHWQKSRYQHGGLDKQRCQVEIYPLID